MALQNIKILSDTATDGLENKIKGALQADPLLMLYGPPQYSAGARMWVQVLVKGTGFIADGGGTPSAADIADATATGVALLTAVDDDAARAAIGAGTSNLTLGNTNVTAKAGDWVPALADISDMSVTGENIAKAANYTAVRDLLDLGDFATVDAAAAAALLGLGALATLDNITLAQVTDAGDLAALDGVTLAQVTNMTAFARTLMADGVNAATFRNLIELGQLAQLNEVTAAQISDGTITNSEVSPAAAIDATKIHVAANANGMAAGDLQAALNSLAARIDAIEP